MSVEINIYEIILQLVKTDNAFDESDLSKLLSISTVHKGFGLYNGVLTGTVTSIIALLLKVARKVQILAPVALFAVVAGATSTSSVGLPIATGSIRTAGTAASAFVWFFRRTDVSPYPLIPP